jgi:hypothetical protein
MTRSRPTRSTFHRAATMAALSTFLAAAQASAGWETPAQPQARAEIVFTDNGKTIFDLACAHNIVLFLKYPGKKKSGAATMVISSGKQSIPVRGDLEKNDAGELLFTAARTGKTPDPADMDAVMALLFSRLELTFTAEGAKYVLPGMDGKVIEKYRSDC